jgi:uncharacterized membrane protein YphA (DoxX/SURF4 family)
MAGSVIVSLCVVLLGAGRLVMYRDERGVVAIANNFASTLLIIGGLLLLLITQFPALNVQFKP